MGKLDGRIAAITGGNSGIGRAAARAFHREGAAVAVLGREERTLRDTGDLLGDRGMAHRGDVSRPGDLEAFFAATAERFGPLDVLMASAGLGEVQPLAEADEEHFDRLATVNFRGVFFTLQRSLAHLRDGASVILVGSMAHRMGIPGYAVYSATKAAVRSLGRSAAAELVDRDIRVNTLSPGPTETPSIERMGYTRDQVRAAVAERNPMGRMASADEIAEAALFLACDDSSYMTGAEIVVDGGQSELG